MYGGMKKEEGLPPPAIPAISDYSFRGCASAEPKSASSDVLIRGI